MINYELLDKLKLKHIKNNDVIYIIYIIYYGKN